MQAMIAAPTRIDATDAIAAGARMNGTTWVLQVVELWGDDRTRAHTAGSDTSGPGEVMGISLWAGFLRLLHWPMRKRSDAHSELAHEG